MAEDAQYEFTSLPAIRGTEAKTIATWEKDGWELDSRSQGLLRTELTFHRVKPATLGARMFAAFRRMGPQARWSLLAVSAGLIVLVVVVGVVVGMRCGGDTSESTAPATEADAVPSETSADNQAPAATSSASLPTTAAADEVLTVENNEDLAALVAVTDPFEPAIEEFAAEYRGRTIEFDGNITAMANHGGSTMRYDLIINTGDFLLEPVRTEVR